MFSDNDNPKNYKIVVKIPKDGKIHDILAYCTYKTGARTLGGCAHSSEVLYYLTVNKSIILDKPNTTQKRVSISGVIDLHKFKAQKKMEQQSASQQSSNNIGSASDVK